MRRMMIGFVLAICVGASLQAARAQQPAPPNNGAPAAAAATPAPIPLAPEVRELLQDQRVLNALIRVQEAAKGDVKFEFSIAELRALLAAKQDKVAAWVKAHVPEGWVFDLAQGAFVPPGKAEGRNQNSEKRKD